MYKYNKIIPKEKHYYHYNQKEFEGIIQVTDTTEDKSEFYGDVIYEIRNPVKWGKTGLMFFTKNLVKEITEKDQPEYFI